METGKYRRVDCFAHTDAITGVAPASVLGGLGCGITKLLAIFEASFSPVEDTTADGQINGTNTRYYNRDYRIAKIRLAFDKHNHVGEADGGQLPTQRQQVFHFAPASKDGDHFEETKQPPAVGIVFDPDPRHLQEPFPKQKVHLVLVVNFQTIHVVDVTHLVIVELVLVARLRNVFRMEPNSMNIASLVAVATRREGEKDEGGKGDGQTKRDVIKKGTNENGKGGGGWEKGCKHRVPTKPRVHTHTYHSQGLHPQRSQRLDPSSVNAAEERRERPREVVGRQWWVDRYTNDGIC
jgi:hypothetical protein